ncbi:hypothetical protein KFK09_008655 [Dendrobium nobile]|uniref:CCHC-type domain-containing protein n=1 Tax=Dendrobium nobile TaxID=94219 RepID=A0A8T3BKP4_DENNO|nr:hypothetical protein KFK09_008655 [Dendrobium nobile]
MRDELRQIRTATNPVARPAAPATIPGPRLPGQINPVPRQAPIFPPEFSDSGDDEPREQDHSDSDDYNRRPVFNPPRRQWQHRREPEGVRLKLDIPSFDGRLHIEDYLEWESAVENFFEYMEVSPDKQVKYVACRLKGGAIAWWMQLCQTRQREGRGPIRNWKRMKQLMRRHFLPTDFEQLLYIQYQQCRQGQRTVSEYTEEFYRLSARNNLTESENQLVARYVVSQAVNFALKAESQLQRPHRQPVYRRSFQEGNATPSKAATQHSNTPVTAQAPVSNAISEPRAGVRPRIPGRDNPYAKPTAIKCFRCLQPGHKSNECPNRPQVQFMEGEEEAELTGLGDELEETIEELAADEGEPILGILEKLLLAPRKPVESQRNSLFRTKCTINGKVCDVVIDSGCTENIISKAVVQALQIKTSKNPHPFKISWVKKGVDFTISEFCKVTFTIGKSYLCQVTCDVIDMDVCHLILGRPWQFDSGAIHDV